MTTVESTFGPNNFNGSKFLSSATANISTFAPEFTSDAVTDLESHLNSQQIFIHEPGNFIGTDQVARIRDAHFVLALPVANFASPLLSELFRLPSVFGFGATILGAAGVVWTGLRNRHLLTGEMSVVSYHQIKAKLSHEWLPITASCYKSLDFCETGVVSPTEYEITSTL